MLEFSRIEAGRAQANYQASDLSAFTAELASNFRSAMQRAGLVFTVNCRPLSQPVFVDREMWEKIVLNLLSNALKYTLEGSVTVAMEESGGSACLSITDTGAGIPEEELPHVFKRFHRVEGMLSRTHEGSGIGLALVAELVRLHGGHVEVTREIGRGSRFFCEVRLGLALEGPGVVGWEWDPGQDELKNSRRSENILGASIWSVAEGLRFVHPEDEPAHRARVTRIASEGGYYHAEFRVRCGGTGETVWLEERARSVLDENNKVCLIVGVTSDITERKKAEEELRRNNDELLLANRELEEFAYVASHDLQEPLRMVNIYSQLLLRRTNLGRDSEAGQYAAFVQKGVSRMEELINDLMLYSRVIHPEQDAQQTASLESCLDQALSVLQMRIEETGATFGRQPLPEVMADERQLSLVFQNLLSNAMKYQSAGVHPQIHIWAELDGDTCVVHVSDNGIGFLPAYAERIFGLFKRLHKDEYPGTGLGLAICKRVIERFKGNIWAVSAGEGEGATFSFTLPLARTRSHSSMCCWPKIMKATYCLSARY